MTYRIRRRSGPGRRVALDLDLLAKAAFGPAGLSLDERRALVEQAPDLAESLAGWVDPALEPDVRLLATGHPEDLALYNRQAAVYDRLTEENR